MLDPTTTNKCKECDKKAKHILFRKYYCREHYILEMFECDDVHDYLNKKKISHMHHADDNHIIINQRHKSVIEMCNLLGVEYWFGKGFVGDTDLSNSMHINTS